MTPHRPTFLTPTRNSTKEQNFNAVADLTCLSERGLADLLGVQPNSVRQWRKGRRDAPEGVLAELRAYVAGMTDA